MARKKRKTKSAKKKRSLRLSRQNKVILGSLLVLLSIALFFSFISFYFNWQDDQSLLTEFADRNKEARNLLNKFGAAVSHFFMFKGFGLASLVFPVLLCLTGLYMFLGIDLRGLLTKWIWGLVLLIWVSVSLGFLGAQQPLLGGQIGFEMNDFLQDYTGKIGVMLLLLFGLVVILVRLFGFDPQAVGQAFSRLNVPGMSLSGNRKASETGASQPDATEATAAAMDLTADGEGSQEAEPEPVKPDPYTHKKDIPSLSGDSQPADEDPGQELEIEVAEQEEETDETDLRSSQLVSDFGEFDPTLELSKYKFPHLDLLDTHGASGVLPSTRRNWRRTRTRL